MSKAITEGMNILPRLSYRWLKVNDFRFKEAVEISSKPYKLEFMPPNVNPDIILEGIQKTDFPRKNAQESFGVSRELVDLAMTKPNGGVYLNLPQGKKLAEPIHLKYNLTQDNDTLLDYNIIRAEKNSSVTVIMEYLGDPCCPAYHNGVTKIYAAEGAEVTLIKVQNLNGNSLHFDSSYVEIAPYGTVRFLQVELGSSHTITNYQGVLAENAHGNVSGMYLGDKGRELDLSYHMIHKGYRSTSDILVKGALKDKSRKVFRGTLDFKRGSHLSTGNEEEYVLLLDPTVKSDAVPLLLSEEDDIQGGHAASAGKVDVDQLFYLMTRGLSAEEATQTIVKASFQPILDQLPMALQLEIQQELGKRLVAHYV